MNENGFRSSAVVNKDSCIDFRKIKYPCYIIFGNNGNIYLINNTLGEELYKWYDTNKEKFEKV